MATRMMKLGLVGSVIIPTYHHHCMPAFQQELKERKKFKWQEPTKMNFTKREMQSGYFQLNVKSNQGLHWFCFTLLCYWSRKLEPFSQPPDAQQIAALNSVWFYFEFSLALKGVYLSSDWWL